MCCRVWVIGAWFGMGATSTFAATKKQPMLFDLHDDPLENRNIAAKAKGEAARLSKLLGLG